MAKLEFRYGAMNSGKSTLLMQVAHNYEENGMKSLIIKSKIDTKGENTLVSRMGVIRKVDIILDSNESLLSNKYKSMYKGISCILVDEAQFLSKDQVEDLWKISKLLDISVLCFGLARDFKTNSFEGSKRLFELADTYTELITVCACGKKARFNARKIDGKYILEGKQNVIDGSNKDILYEPMCGKCYINKVLGIKKL